MLKHAYPKVDFSVGTGIYMLPSNLNFSIGKPKGYSNKILVSNTDMKIGSNRDINKDRKKFPVTPHLPVIPAVHQDAVGVTKLYNLKMLTKKRNDEKTSHYTFDCGGWAYCLSFLVENKWRHYYSQSLVPW